VVAADGVSDSHLPMINDWEDEEGGFRIIRNPPSRRV